MPALLDHRTHVSLVAFDVEQCLFDIFQHFFYFGGCFYQIGNDRIQQESKQQSAAFFSQVQHIGFQRFHCVGEYRIITFSESDDYISGDQQADMLGMYLHIGIIIAGIQDNEHMVRIFLDLYDMLRCQYILGIQIVQAKLFYNTRNGIGVGQPAYLKPVYFVRIDQLAERRSTLFYFGRMEYIGIVLGETNVGYSLMLTGIIILIRQMPVRNMSFSVHMCSFFSSHRYPCLIQFHNSDACTSQLNMLIVVMTDTGN